MKFGIFVQISNELMFFKRSPFQFAFKNSFIHKIDQDFILMSEKNEEIDDYAAQDLKIMNTMEATKHFWSWFLVTIVIKLKMTHSVGIALKQVLLWTRIKH